MKTALIGLLIVCSLLFLLAMGCSGIARKHLFFPTHQTPQTSLSPWMADGEVIGYTREVESPANIWLMLHGNAGQAAHRDYAIPHYAPNDAVFVLEYPGYGQRGGKPSRDSFNRAAQEAYVLLRDKFPGIPVCVTGVSIGSGPASFLGTLSPAPDKIVLITPFDRLSHVAKHHTSSLVTGLLLKDDWDNVEALSHYFGPVDIFTAEHDTVIPASHARALADAVPSATLTVIPGGHNEWAGNERVRIRNP